MNIEAMCEVAQARVTSQINRSAGQHLRAMKAIAAPAAPTSSDIYAMSMESDVAYTHAKWLCAQAGVAFPPVNQGVPA